MGTIRGVPAGVRNRNLTRAFFYLVVAILALTAAISASAASDEKDTFDQDSIIKDASEFFGETTEGLAKVLEKAFKEQGRPNGYIKGQEIAGAITVGLRYGDGTDDEIDESSKADGSFGDWCVITQSNRLHGTGCRGWGGSRS